MFKVKTVGGRRDGEHVGAISCSGRSSTCKGNTIEYLLRLGVKAGFSPLSGGR